MEDSTPQETNSEDWKNLAMSLLENSYADGGIDEIDDEWARKRELKMDFVARYVDKVKDENIVLKIDQPRTGLQWGTDGMKQNLNPIDFHHFIMLVGDSGSGKTSLSYFMARQNVKRGKKVLFASLEMGGQELIETICRKSAGITQEQWSDNSHSKRQRDLYVKKYEEYKSMAENLWIHKPKDNTLACIEKMITTLEPDMVIIDNLDIVVNSMGGRDTETDKQVKAAMFFMEITNKLKIPIMMIHHTNKAGGIRGSGKLKDCADTTVIVSRDFDAETEDEKAQVALTQVKDRDWGNLTKLNIYFNKGDYSDFYISNHPHPDATHDSNSARISDDMVQSIFSPEDQNNT